MYQIQRVLYALNLTEIDRIAIKHALALSKVQPIDKYYFLNIQDTLELPESVVKKFPDVFAPKDETVKHEIKTMIEEEFGQDHKIDYEIKVDDGNITEEIIRWSKIKEVDLVVVGRTFSDKESKLSYAKMGNLAPCSIIVLPENMPEKIHTILVPVDFSESSKMALEQSIVFASSLEDVKIQCVHFYSVPTGYHLSGKSKEEFSELMAHNARDQFSDLMNEVENMGISIGCDYVEIDDSKIARAIHNYAIKKQSTLITLGSKGRTKLASLVRGSVAERLLEINQNFPMFIAKEKNHNMDFLDSMLD